MVGRFWGRGGGRIDVDCFVDGVELCHGLFVFGQRACRRDERASSVFVGSIWLVEDER